MATKKESEEERDELRDELAALEGSVHRSVMNVLGEMMDRIDKLEGKGKK